MDNNLLFSPLAATKEQSSKSKLEKMQAALLNQSAATDTKKTKESSKEFEAMFLSEMFNIMSEGVEEDPLFGGGKGEAMFRSFTTDEYAKLISERGGIGLADHVMKSLLTTQED